MGYVAQRVTDLLPTGRETAILIRDMLRYHGYRSTGAHVIAHSYGTFVTAFIKHTFPNVINRVSLLDPVCFHVLTTITNIMNSFRRSTNFMDAGISFCACRELYTVYAALKSIAPCWQQAEWVPGEDFSGGPSKSFVFLAENDSVVQVQTIRRQLLPYADSVTVWYEKGRHHGSFLLDNNLARRLCLHMYKMSSRDRSSS